MPRTDGRIEKGQSLRSAISARAWNRAQDAADLVLGVRPGAAAGNSIQPDRPSNVVLIRNDSGMTVPVCGVLTITGTAIDPQAGSMAGTGSAAARAKEFFRQPVLVGNKVTNSTVNKVAIALEPVAAGSVGRFAVGGSFPCKVKVTNGFIHTHARGRPDDVTQLIGTNCGPVKLLWFNPETGDDKWAVGQM